MIFPPICHLKNLNKKQVPLYNHRQLSLHHQKQVNNPKILILNFVSLLLPPPLTLLHPLLFLSTRLSPLHTPIYSSASFRNSKYVILTYFVHVRRKCSKWSNVFLFLLLSHLLQIYLCLLTQTKTRFLEVVHPALSHQHKHNRILHNKSPLHFRWKVY